MGGAMDLVAGVKRVIVVMDHKAKDEKKVMRQCTRPLTGKGAVDILITDLAVFEIDKTGMTLTELAPAVTLAEIAERTDARYKIAPALQGRRREPRAAAEACIGLDPPNVPVP
jgi:3-oxoacid CoA-transferase subunit B